MYDDCIKRRRRVYDADRFDDGVGIPENTKTHVTVSCKTPN